MSDGGRREGGGGAGSADKPAALSSCVLKMAAGEKNNQLTLKGGLSGFYAQAEPDGFISSQKPLVL